MHDCVGYRANARACAKLAEEIVDPRTKIVLLTMAEAWLRLADYVESRKEQERLLDWKKDAS
jgi:hypothetical protein